MNDLKNKPAVTIALIVVLVGAVAVTMLRIRGSTASAGDRGVAQEQQSAAQSKRVVPLDDIPPERDPFGHSVLYTQPALGSKRTESPTDMQMPAGALPMPPLRIEGMRPADAQLEPPPPGHTSKPPTVKPTDEPRGWKLQAVVSGDRPLAVIKDGSGRTHFVHEGDQLGDGAFVAKIINGTVAIRYGGTFAILSLERGSGGNEKTE